MSIPGEVLAELTPPATADYPPTQLELIRERMQHGHDRGYWYLAGELEERHFQPY